MSTIVSWLMGAWDFVRSWFWQGLVVIAVAAIGIFLVRPFDAPADPTLDDVATAWNQSIGRLGILPLYPPTEDFNVGDLWAVVADSDNVPLLGKAVRIGHIDLRDRILASSLGPVFADTADLPTGAAFRRQERKEVAPSTPDNRIPLALTAFPGISISHITQRSAAAGSATGWFGSARNGEQREQIKIKSAETYGVPTVDAIIRLNGWCRAAETKGFCEDGFARKAIAFAVSDRVLATKEGKFATRLQLQLVTRVYLTRQIEQQRFDGTAGGAIVQALSDPTKQPADTPPARSGASAPDAGEQSSTALDNVGKGLASSGAAGAKVTFLRSDASAMVLSETFQRPIAFGYRAVTITLPQAEPAKDQLP